MPLTIQCLPSSESLAVVVMPWTSEPACGSEIASEMNFLPLHRYRKGERGCRVRRRREGDARKNVGQDPLLHRLVAKVEDGRQADDHTRLATRLPPGRTDTNELLDDDELMLRAERCERCSTATRRGGGRTK